MRTRRDHRFGPLVTAILIVTAIGAVCPPAAAADSGQPPQAVAVGNLHTCLLTGGKVFCWGENSGGELGDGSFERSLTPSRLAVSGTILQGKSVAEVAVGRSHSCAVADDGSLACWGTAFSGALGRGTGGDTAARPVPVQIAGTPLAGDPAIHVAAGDGHSCAVSASGTISCWGLNDSGQLGDGTTTDRFVPTAVAVAGSALGGKAIRQVAAGHAHTCALTNDGQVACWGQNDIGQLGDGTRASSSIPVAVKTQGTVLDGTAVAQIAAGSAHTCALTVDGAMACWGSGSEGQLGVGSLEESAPVTVDASGTALAGAVVTEIAAGAAHTCALTDRAEAACWGFNRSGQLGDGTTTSRWKPTLISSSGTVLDGMPVLGLGRGSAALHSCAWSTVPRLACWGANIGGQIGDSTTENRTLPTAVAAGSLTRTGGTDRFATSILLSQLDYAHGGAGGVVLSRSDLFPDALAGAPLASALGGPVLITPPTYLRADVLNEILRVLPKGETVYVLGGRGALSESVEASLLGAGYAVKRLGGSSRFETSLLIADEIQRLTERPAAVFVATGLNFPDALAAGAAAGSFNVGWRSPGVSPAVVVLSDDRRLPPPVASYLTDLATSKPQSVIVAVGGQASDAVHTALGCDPDDGIFCYAGADRYQTATWIAYDWYDSAAGFGLATGLSFPDALTGAPSLASRNWPVLLVPPGGPVPSRPDDSVAEYLRDSAAGRVDALIIGGPSAVSPSVAEQSCALANIVYCDIPFVP